jgi:AcrR family transcriptional regulator
MNLPFTIESMTQFLKEEVRQAILEAGRDVFAQKGYAEATVAEIARAARVSTGNIYRYFENKDVLFDEVVPKAWVKEFRGLLRERMRAARGIDGRAASLGAAHVDAVERSLAFTIAHRREVVILLEKARGSRYEKVRGEVVSELVALAVDHAASLTPPRRVTPTMRFALDRIYEGLVTTSVMILVEYRSEEAVREAVADFGRYHLAGLSSFFA